MDLLEELPYLSVVVPVYNGKKTIQECIESLLAQEYPKARYEVIVVDNKSTDGTPLIVQEYPVTLLSESGRQSSYAARNTGARHAAGEIVAFTDADCVADVHWLAKLAQPFSDERVGAVSGAVLNSPPTNDVERFLSALDLFRNPGVDNNFPIMFTGNAGIRRQLLCELGLFNDRLYTGGDVDLGWRLHHETGYAVKSAPDAVVWHKHRTTLRGMYKQFRRHGFGEIMLDAMHRHRPGYFRPPKLQALRMLSQFVACLNYVRALVFRSIRRMFGRCDRQEQIAAFYWLVAESANLVGKIKGLWVTRFFLRNPAELCLEDPKER